MRYHEQEYKRNLTTALYISIPAQHRSSSRIAKHSFQHMWRVALPLNHNLQVVIATLQQIKFVMHDCTNQWSV